jgi:pSer/pThr/pTyr-binding forkhead associated (FHA) protein
VNVSLVLIKADGRTREVPLKHFPKSIGREEGNGIRIPEGTVSRRHCELSLDEEEDALIVRDLNSSNGTFVNGERVSNTELSPGDLLAVGPAVFVVRMDGFPEQIDAEQAYREGQPKPGQGGDAGSGTKTAGPAMPKASGDSEGSSVLDFDFDLDDEDEGQPKL